MPATRKVSWAELRVGLLVLTALAILGAFVFAASQGRREDSEASVTTEGLLGQSVLEVSRGVEGAVVPPGGSASRARSAAA